MGEFKVEKETKDPERRKHKHKHDKHNHEKHKHGKHKHSDDTEKEGSAKKVGEMKRKERRTEDGDKKDDIEGGKPEITRRKSTSKKKNRADEYAGDRNKEIKKKKRKSEEKAPKSFKIVSIAMTEIQRKEELDGMRKYGMEETKEETEKLQEMKERYAPYKVLLISGGETGVNWLTTFAMTLATILIISAWGAALYYILTPANTEDTENDNTEEPTMSPGPTARFLRF